MTFDELHMAISQIRVKRISKGRELSPKQWCNMMTTQIEPVAEFLSDLMQAQAEARAKEGQTE